MLIYNYNHFLLLIITLNVRILSGNHPRLKSSLNGKSVCRLGYLEESTILL